MIKVYDSTEKSFNNNGIKILKPLFAQITKKDNSDYYLELEDTIDNLNYYQKGLIIRTTTNWGVQGFRCDNPKIENNRIKCKAWHLTYDSKNYIVRDSNSIDKSCNAALNHFNLATDIPSPFTTISDIETILSCRMVRKSLYEVFNELIDETKYGGHLYRDNYTFGIKSSIGEDRGVVLAANKNITGMNVSENWDDVCTKILPYTTDGQKVIALDDVYVSLTEKLYDIPYSKVVKFENPYKEEDYNDRDSFEIAVKTWLKNEAMAYLEKNKLPKVNYTVEAQINNVSDIGDVIHVKHPKCNIDLITNVISITYDCIRNKYVKIEFGNFKKEIKNLTQQITESANKYSDSLVSESNTYMKNELLDATSKINAVLGNSYVIYDGDKILIVNKLPKEEAKDVIMISNGGIGFSRTGINGTFKNAWTIDGNFCADFITTGKINTDLIEGYSNLELAVQNSLLSITPQYCIEGTDNWSDTIPTTETWQKILTRNKYTSTNGKITYSKVIPYVEGMNNLINSIEGTNVSIYNSNDEEMGLESIVLEGRCMQETSTQGKNIVPTDFSEWESGEYFMVDGSKTAENARVRVKRLIEVKPTTTYYVKTSAYFSFVLREYDASGAFTRSIGGLESVKGTTFTTSENGYYIGVSLYEGTSYADFAEKWADVKPFICLNSISDKEYADFIPNKPCPDYPSEVKCIKAKNLLNNEFRQGSESSTNSNLYIFTSNACKLEAGTYTFSNNLSSTMQYAIFGTLNNFPNDETKVLNSGWKKGNMTFTISKTLYIGVIIKKVNGTNITPDDVKDNDFQIELGLFATPIMPYGTIQIKNIGHQLLSITEGTYSHNGITATVNNGVITLNGTATSNSFIDIPLNEVYKDIVMNKMITVSLNNPIVNNSCRLRIDNPGYYDVIANVKNSVKTMAITEALPTRKITIRTASGGSYANYLLKPQIELGSSATQWSIFQLQTLNIDLQGNELCSVGDVKDELVIKGGRAKIIKRIGKYVANNDLGANGISDILVDLITPALPIEANLTANALALRTMSNLMKGIRVQNTGFNGTTSTSRIRVSLSKKYASSYAEASAYLTTNHFTIYYPLSEEQEIGLGEVDNISLFTRDNNILNSESANMKIGYYTDYTFYKTVMEQYAKIDLNTDNINIELAKKTNSKDIIATINMSIEKGDDGSLIQINSDKLNIKNKVFNLQSDDIQITSPNFSLTTEGKITSKSGEIGGFKLTDTAFSTHVKDSYTYTQTDAARVLEIANGSTATEVEKKKYDVNEDGVIDRLDYTIILRKIYGYEATEGDFYIYSNDPRYMIKTSTNGTKTKPTKIGLTMMSTTEYVGCRANFTNFDDSTSQTIIDGGQINCVALTQTSLEQHKKNIKKFSNALEEIKRTDIYQYNLKSESDDKKKHLGFVIGKNFNYSHLITAENEEGNEIGVDNYSMTSLCLQAIKEQQVIIEDLEEKINALMKGIK